MEWLCPLCNGLQQVDEFCPGCGSTLCDGGNLQDYYGPYSPYMEQNAYGELAEFGASGECVHLLFCPNCGYDERIHVQNVMM